MFKRVLLTGVLCIGLVGLFATQAVAYPARIGGWGSTHGSVCVWSDWFGVSNYEKTPTDVTVTILLLEVQVHYLNPGGGGGGVGTPFYPNVEAQGTQIGLKPLDKKGKAFSEICFNDQELIEAIGIENIPPPPNPQWTLDSSTIVVRKMHVTIKGYSDFDDLYPPAEKETAHAAGLCTLNNNQTAYGCVEEERWIYSNKVPNCPYE